MGFRSLDEHLVAGVLDFLPLRERVGLGLVSPGFLRIVRNPHLNSRLHLGGGLPRLMEFLFTPPTGLWCALKEVKIDFSKIPDEHQLALHLRALTTLECMHLLGASAEFLLTLFADPQGLSSLKSLILEDAECGESQDWLLGMFLRFRCLEELVLNEVSFVKSVGGSAVPSPRSLEGADFWHQIQKIDLYLIPFAEVIGFVRASFPSHMPLLKSLKFKCLSSVRDSSLLGAILDSRLAELPMLEELEVGILTASVAQFLQRKCMHLRRLVVPSRLAVSAGILTHLPRLTTIDFRITSNAQLEELASLLADHGSLASVRLQWNTANGISVHALLHCRHVLSQMRSFHVQARSLEASLFQPMAQPDSGFRRFYAELCQYRIVCECDECVRGERDEEHVLELAEEEWDQLDPGIRAHVYP